MGADTMAALEEQLRTYEDELMRLRIENEQLRQSSQAFGELAERLSVALRTATRVNGRRSCGGGLWPAARGGGILGTLAGGFSLERIGFGGCLRQRHEATEASRRLGKTGFERSAKHQLGFEHLLLEPLRHGVAVG